MRRQGIMYFLLLACAVYILLWHKFHSNNRTSKTRHYADEEIHYHGHSNANSTSRPRTPNIVVNHTGYYIDLASYDPNNTEFQIVKDICIESVPGKINRTRLVVYDYNVSTEGPITIKAEAYGKLQFLVHWTVHKRKGPIPEHLTRKNQTLFLYFEKYPNNFFHFIHDSFKGLYGLMQRLGRLNAPEGNHVIRFLCKFVNDVHYREFIDRLGPNMHFGDCKDHAVVKDVCFPHGVAGFIRPNLIEFAQAQYEAFGVGRCETNFIILMNRSSRRIGNIHELGAAIENMLHESRYINTSVEVIDFAEFSVREQFKKISCTRMLIGVQGAGMHWHVFQPRVAGVLELGWKQWPAGMYSGLARRRELMADKMTTEQFEIDWEQWAHANLKNATTMTEAEKNEAFILKSPGWGNSNPSKFGIGYFDVQTVVRKVKIFLKAFQEKGVLL